MDQNRNRNGVEAQLQQVVRNRLESSGELAKLKSEMRSMVLNDIRNGDTSPLNSVVVKEPKSPTQVANHLVMEYLQWIGFQYTSEMFATESGCDHSSPRDYVMARAEAAKEFDKELPLMLSMAMKLMKVNEEKQ